MVRIYRAEDSERTGRAGYDVRYVADLTFKDSLDSCGVILVDIKNKGRSSPHAHEQLEEVFIAMTNVLMYINDTRYELNEGDVVVVEPNEEHSFETEDDNPCRIIALKFPNLKDDKVVPTRGSED
ncbi:MAG: cupin domain-containing protein [Candidatus Thorarchaeota archaeon]